MRATFSPANLERAATRSCLRRAPFHPACSASKESTWPLPPHPSEAARCASRSSLGFDKIARPITISSFVISAPLNVICPDPAGCPRIRLVRLLAHLLFTSVIRLIELWLTTLPAYPRTIRLPRMRCARFLPLYSRNRIRLTRLPAHPRTTRLPRMRFVFLSYQSLTRIRLTTLPTYPRTTRLPRMSSIRRYDRSRVRQAKTQQEPTRHETDDFCSRYHESLLG